MDMHSLTTQKASLRRILNITELAELVLTFLPARDLLLAQSICWDLRETVIGSTKLKRKLFLHGPVQQKSTELPQVADTTASSLVINTMLFKRQTPSKEFRRSEASTKLDFRMLPTNLSGSYKTMTLTQPVAKSIRIVWTFGDPISRIQYEEDVVERREGVVFGDVMASFAKASGREHPLLLIDEPVLELCSVEVLST